MHASSIVMHAPSIVMHAPRIVIPAKAGIQAFYHYGMRGTGFPPAQE